MDGSDDATQFERSSTSRGGATACNAGGDVRRRSAAPATSRNDESRDEDERLGLGRRPRDPSAVEGEGEDEGFKALPLASEMDGGVMSLRQWLDRPSRGVEAMECLHIFRQIAVAVAGAHSQGVVVGNVRPSCFVVSFPLNRVAFIESASCSTSGSDESCGGADEEDDRLRGESRVRVLSARVGEDEERRSGRETATELAGDLRVTFPLKRILGIESKWYTSSEEIDGSVGTFASDVYRLGVLLFELFCSFDSTEEKMRTMSNLRHRVLPPHLLLKWPKEASFCLWLLHPQPDSRPKMNELLKSDFLNQPRDNLEEREAAVRLREDIEDDELLLEFLLHLQKRKQEIADELHDSISFLSADIEEIVNRQTKLKNKSFSETDREDHLSPGKFDLPSFSPTGHDDSFYSSSRKRLKPELEYFIDGERPKLLAEAQRSESDQRMQENLLLRSSRLMKNFRKLETVYFNTRSRLMKSTENQAKKLFHFTSSGRGSVIRTEGSSVDDLVSKERTSGRNKNTWVDPFLDGLCKYLSFSKLKVKADLKQTDLLNSLNLVCSMGFDRDQEYFATAGVNKKIKIFECDNVLNEDRDIHYPVVEMANKSKISCISWNSYIKSQLASSDFDGVVQVWDITRCQVFTEMKEHEKRVWSVDFSLADPTRLASSSDDGTVKLWNINQAGSVGTIRTKANVCSVQFQPDSAHSLAIGSADHKIYCYDLRNSSIPCCTLLSHMKTVSYVKYLDSSSIVSASTDNSLRLWDLPASPLKVIESPLQTFTGHTNIKNFVGLSISDGYIATGSETNEVFIYYKTFPMPVLSYKFSIIDPISGQEIDDTSQFISSVCWRGQSSILLAANSSGNIKLLEMV